MEQITIWGKKIAYCDWCGQQCQVADKPSNPDARLLKLADEAKGLCPTCSAKSTLMLVPHIREVLDEKPESLLVPQLQQHFTWMMQSGKADADPSEIDWQKMCDDWHKYPKKRR